MADSYTESRDVLTTVTETVLRLDSEEVDALLTLLGSGTVTLREGAPLHRVHNALLYEPEPPAESDVGDRVRVVAEWSTAPGSRAGQTGVFVREDPSDPELRYLVRFDTDGEDWVHAVERIGEAP